MTPSNLVIDSSAVKLADILQVIVEKRLLLIADNLDSEIE